MASPPAVGTERLANYISGTWRPVDAVDTLDDIDPATGEVTALVPLSGARQVREAVEAARAAQPGWRTTPPQRRARILLALRAELERRREELVALITTDMGKTLADADGEVTRGIESVESAAAIPHLLKGEALEGVAEGVNVELVRQPVGVVAAITPFNFPAMIPLWFLPYAIACGNSFILKPSEQDPRPAALIVEIVDSIGEIPPGIVNMVARPSDAGDHRLRLRRRRPALPRRLGLRRRRRPRSTAGGTRRAGRGGVGTDGWTWRRPGERHLPHGLGRGARACGDGDRPRRRERGRDCSSTGARCRAEPLWIGTIRGARPARFWDRRSRSPIRSQSLPVTASGEAARRYRYGAEAGMLGVNVGVPAPVAWFPFSGWKDSMAGDLHASGMDAVDFYTRKKVITSRW